MFLFNFVINLTFTFPFSYFSLIQGWGQGAWEMLQCYVLFNGVLRREIMEGDRSLNQPVSLDVLMLYACFHDSTSLPQSKQLGTQPYNLTLYRIIDFLNAIILLPSGQVMLGIWSTRYARWVGLLTFIFYFLKRSAGLGYICNCHSKACTSWSQKMPKGSVTKRKEKAQLHITCQGERRKRKKRCVLVEGDFSDLWRNKNGHLVVTMPLDLGKVTKYCTKAQKVTLSHTSFTSFLSFFFLFFLGLKLRQFLFFGFNISLTLKGYEIWAT